MSKIDAERLAVFLNDHTDAGYQLAKDVLWSWREYKGWNSGKGV